MNDSVFRTHPITAAFLDVADGIRAGQVSPIELTEALLARIDSVDDRLMSYATLMAESASESAREAEQEIQQATTEVHSTACL